MMSAHPQLGVPNKVWTYAFADGTPFCSVARWDWPDKEKDIRQFHVNGKGVQWKRPEGLAPLFNLHDLLNGSTGAVW